MSRTRGAWSRLRSIKSVWPNTKRSSCSSDTRLWMTCSTRHKRFWVAVMRAMAHLPWSAKTAISMRWNLKAGCRTPQNNNTTTTLCLPAPIANKKTNRMKMRTSQPNSYARNMDNFPIFQRVAPKLKRTQKMTTMSRLMRKRVLLRQRQTLILKTKIPANPPKILSNIPTASMTTKKMRRRKSQVTSTLLRSNLIRLMMLC